MALITLTVWPFSNVTNFQAGGSSLAALALADGWTLVGGASFDACLNSGNDSAYIDNTTASQSIFFFFQNLDASSNSIPIGSTINSVTFQVRLRATGGTINIRLSDAQGFYYQLGANSSFGSINIDLATAPADPVTVAAFTTYSTAALTVNPLTSVAWVLADLLANMPNNADITLTGGYWQWAYALATAASTDVSAFTLLVDYTAAASPVTWNLSTTFAAPAGFNPGVGSKAVALPINVQGGVDAEGQPAIGLLPGQPLVGVGTPGISTPPQNPRLGVPPIVINPSGGSGGRVGFGTLALPDNNQFRLERFDVKYRPEEHIG